MNTIPAPECKGRTVADLKKLASIQVIFFDAAGTLFQVRGSVADIYLRYAEKHGFRRTADSQAAIKTAFARAFQEAPPPVFATMDPVKIKQCERLWWFDIVHNVFYRVGMFEGFDEFFEEVFHAFDGPDWWMLYPDTLGALKQLREHGFELGIISNFDSRLFNVLRSLGLLDFFDTVTIASLAHSAKPAPLIFIHALEKHAVEPCEALHIGDNMKEDVEGARAAGLHGLLIERETRSAPTSTAPTIHTLDELLPLLETFE